MTSGNPRPTIVTTDDPRRLSPIESSIMDWCNLAHAARKRAVTRMRSKTSQANSDHSSTATTRPMVTAT